MAYTCTLGLIGAPKPCDWERSNWLHNICRQVMGFTKVILFLVGLLSLPMMFVFLARRFS